MAPSRPRAAGLDDARSEASSTREKGGNAHHHHATGTASGGVTKGRRTNKSKEAKNAAANGAHSSSAAAATTNATTAATGPTSAPHNPVQDPAHSGGIPWSSLPTSVLHAYRHAYRLPTPSAHSSEFNRMMLSQDIGRSSPTAVFARRKARAMAKATLAQNTKMNGVTTGAGSGADGTTNGHGAVNGGKGKMESLDKDNNNNTPSTTSIPTTTTNNAKITTAQTSSDPSSTTSSSTAVEDTTYPNSPIVGRVPKSDLALAVRKHFNAMGLSEPDAIAKFLYKVREERKGQHLRLRFTAT